MSNVRARYVELKAIDVNLGNHFRIMKISGIKTIIEGGEYLRAMGGTVFVACSLNKVIISRSKDLSRLIANRRRINCETGEAATPDLSTQDWANITILFSVES